MEDLSIDEVLTKIEDAFDASIAPKSMVRSNNNKLHLLFKADAAGYHWLNKSVLALSQRWNPVLCEDSDLDDAAKIGGTERRPGKKSSVLITVSNTADSSSVTLYTGTYIFISSDGEVFSFVVAIDTPIAAGDYVTYYASSTNDGAYAVADIADAAVSRSDSAQINSSIQFSTEDNASYLGYGEETLDEFRSRLINDQKRDDVVGEIQEAIKALPSIYECNCLFNPTLVPVVYDGITLGPKELLIIVTGAPGEDMAEIVAQYSYLITHEVNPLDVVYYYNDLYVNGRYPVYYMNHLLTEYSVEIEYRFNSDAVKQEVAEADLTSLLRKFQVTNVHSDEVTEKGMYDRLSETSLSSISVLNVTLLVSGSEVSYVSVPKTRIPRLVNITYTAHDMRGV